MNLFFFHLYFLCPYFSLICFFSFLYFFNFSLLSYLVCSFFVCLYYLYILFDYIVNLYFYITICCDILMLLHLTVIYITSCQYDTIFLYINFIIYIIYILYIYTCYKSNSQQLFFTTRCFMFNIHQVNGLTKLNNLFYINYIILHLFYVINIC